MIIIVFNNFFPTSAIVHFELAQDNVVCSRPKRGSFIGIPYKKRAHFV